MDSSNSENLQNFHHIIVYNMQTATFGMKKYSQLS